jgi:hypothetical protein
MSHLSHPKKCDILHILRHSRHLGHPIFCRSRTLVYFRYCPDRRPHDLPHRLTVLLLRCSRSHRASGRHFLATLALILECQSRHLSNYC